MPLQGNAEPPAAQGAEQRWRMIRDLIVFEAKMMIEGVRDLVVAPAALVAGIADLIVNGREPGRFFYEVMRLGHRFDLWLNLFGHRRNADNPRRAAAGTVDEHVEHFEALLADESERSETLRTAKRKIDSVLDSFTEDSDPHPSRRQRRRRRRDEGPRP